MARTQSIDVYATSEWIQAVENYMDENNIRTRSEAVRVLVRDGLAYHGHSEIKRRLEALEEDT